MDEMKLSANKFQWVWPLNSMITFIFRSTYYNNHIPIQNDQKLIKQIRNESKSCLCQFSILGIVNPFTFQCNFNNFLKIEI